MLGKAFWRGAVALVGGHDVDEIERRLHELERGRFVRRARRSSVGGEAEYAFLHLLVRDVAYGQIPRAARAAKHRAAAEWIAALGGTASRIARAPRAPLPVRTGALTIGRP